MTTIKFNFYNMEDGDSKKDLEENFLGKRICKATYDGDVLQPIWVRYNTILSYVTNREFVECKLGFILTVGTLFWFCFIVEKIL